MNVFFTPRKHTIRGVNVNLPAEILEQAAWQCFIADKWLDQHPVDKKSTVVHRCASLCRFVARLRRRSLFGWRPGSGCGKSCRVPEADEGIGGQLLCLSQKGAISTCWPNNMTYGMTEGGTVVQVAVSWCKLWWYYKWLRKHLQPNSQFEPCDWAQKSSPCRIQVAGRVWQASAFWKQVAKPRRRVWMWQFMILRLWISTMVVAALSKSLPWRHSLALLAAKVTTKVGRAKSDFKGSQPADRD